MEQVQRDMEKGITIMDTLVEENNPNAGIIKHHKRLFEEKAKMYIYDDSGGYAIYNVIGVTSEGALVVEFYHSIGR